jgi:acyl-CoA oxidase
MSKLPSCYLNNNQQAQYLEGLRAGRATFDDDLKHGTANFVNKNHLWSLLNANPLGLTRGLFLPPVLLQGTPEQAAYWSSLAENGAIVGAYSQTELGHGTFVAWRHSILTPMSLSFIHLVFLRLSSGLVRLDTRAHICW